MAIAARPNDVSEETWGDFLLLRKAKRAPLTQTAIRGIAREADRAGLSLESALRTCCERGWQGFKAEWVQGQQGMQAIQESFRERDLRLITQRVAAFSASVAEGNDGRLLLDH